MLMEYKVEEVCAPLQTVTVWCKGESNEVEWCQFLMVDLRAIKAKDYKRNIMDY